MHDDVGAVLLRPAKVGRGEGIVDDVGDACLSGDCGDGRQVDDEAARIGDRLGEDGLGLRTDSGGERLGFLGVRPFHRPAELLEGVVELVDRAAIELLGGDDLVAGLHQGVEGESLGRVPGGDRERSRAAFQRRHPLLQHPLRRIADASIDVAEGLEPEQGCGVVGAVEHK